jgi:transcriptional regulator with XRE-family HTH domain
VQTATDAALQRRRLLERLRRARLVSLMTQEQVADALDWSESKVLRVEQGVSSVSISDLRALLSLYGVTEPGEVDQIIDMARRSRQRSWTHAYRDVVSSQFLTYLDLEELSTRLWSYDPTYLPGLLQTEQYARAIIGLHSAPETERGMIERRVELRLARQRLLSRPTFPELTFFIDESALRRQVGARSGGSGLMREQLRKILALVAHPRIIVQMLPFTAGEHPGMALGSFIHLRFSDPADRDLVFRESAAGDNTLQTPTHEAKPYEKVFLHLQALALDPSTSREAIRNILGEICGYEP